MESTGIIVGDKSDFQGISLAEKTPLNTDLNVHRVNLEAITSGVMKNKDNLDIKTHLPDISLPQASLYKINLRYQDSFWLKQIRVLHRNLNGSVLIICSNSCAMIHKICLNVWAMVFMNNV